VNDYPNKPLLGFTILAQTNHYRYDHSTYATVSGLPAKTKRQIEQSSTASLGYRHPRTISGQASRIAVAKSLTKLMLPAAVLLVQAREPFLEVRRTEPETELKLDQEASINQMWSALSQKNMTPTLTRSRVRDQGHRNLELTTGSASDRLWNELSCGPPIGFSDSFLLQ
jgi:hypothetical protein